jgi:PadR family transcriptional regulator PadR
VRAVTGTDGRRLDGTGAGRHERSDHEFAKRRPDALPSKLLLYRVFSMTRTRTPSPRTIAVLQALMDDPDSWRYGYDLCSQLGIQPGSMYPILIRLADRGQLQTQWDTSQTPGRPARHMYRLTDAGRAYARSTAAPAPGTSATPTVSALRPQWGGQ